MYDLSLLWLFIVTNLLWLYIVTMASLTMAIHTINSQAAAYDLSVSHSVEPAALQRISEMKKFKKLLLQIDTEGDHDLQLRLDAGHVWI